MRCPSGGRTVHLGGEIYPPATPVIGGAFFVECYVQNPPYGLASELTVTTALQRAYAHWHAGQAAQAEILCRRVMAVWPNQPDAQHLLGIMCHAYGKHEQALKFLRAATRDPRAPAQFYSNLAEMCRQQGLLAEAEQAAKRAVELDPQLIDAWHNLGIIAQECDDLSLSLACLEKVLEARPDSPQAHNNLANTLRRLNENEQAQQHYQQALALDANNVQTLSNLAALLCQQQQFEEATKAAERAMELAPHCVEAYLNRAEIALRRGYLQDAQRWLDALYAFAPESSAGLLLRARLRWAQLRHDDAVNLVRKVVEQAPENPQGQRLLAQFLQAMANPPQPHADTTSRAVMEPRT